MPTYRESLRPRMQHRLVLPFVAAQTRVRAAINDAAGVASVRVFRRPREANLLGIPLRISISREVRWVWLAVLTFVSTSAWWLMQDNRVPDWDSGIHESSPLSSTANWPCGELTRPFTDLHHLPRHSDTSWARCRFSYSVCTRRRLSCRRTSYSFPCSRSVALAWEHRLRAAGWTARGALALGSPMFVSMMHEYELDPPQAAMVAVSVWALLASRRYERVGMAGSPECFAAWR